MSVNVSVQGLGALALDFEELSRAGQRKVLRQATMAGARVGRDEIRAVAPVDEGVTRKAVVAASKKQNPPGKHTSGVRIRSILREDGRRNPAYTWRFSELGTSKEPAAPWIRPAWDGSADAIAEAVTSELAAAIDKAIRR